MVQVPGHAVRVAREGYEQFEVRFCLLFTFSCDTRCWLAHAFTSHSLVNIMHLMSWLASESCCYPRLVEGFQSLPWVRMA